MSSIEKKDRKSPITVFFLAWLIPGLGHLFMGKRLKAAIFFAAISSLFCAGVLIGGDAGWYEQNVLVYLGFLTKFMSGIIFVVTVLVKPFYDNTAAYFEIGNAFLLMAGALNMLVIIDVFDEITGRKALKKGESDVL